ncbi:protein RNA-directed DNA methylation 3 [Diospyros lotus]|uniref:protein RNA-directed DNA methylation 3 n=1 Tax=Diospyros lotus TaxID=55363 RepID=UPI00225A102D|nr:protein RNA-directed DNA methylation 3 [Diospyros lotus]
MVSAKGKEVAGKELPAKRKRGNGDNTGGLRRKRKNRGVLQFFDDAAYEIDEDEGSDDSDFDDVFLEDEFKTQFDNVTGKAHALPFLPKEEELSEEELEKMLEERYKPGSSFVTFADDAYESKGLVEGNAVMPSSMDPTIWKVKCMVGRERHSSFCLMQKYVELNSLGIKLEIISAFALDHVKGYIYIEAERQFDVNEACKGLCTIYSSRIAPVPKNEVSHLLSVRSKRNEVSVGTWARVKNGKYKGDLAQVIAVNNARKKATVKLIPRIDMQAMAEKYGGGTASRKKTATPAPRLISSTELDEFRPLIQYRRDRDTGQAFEILDGLMLKDGYLYKKVSIDSLNFSSVMPSEGELLKFEPSKKEESNCQEWLTQLYGEEKKKHTVKFEKTGGKGGGGKGDGGKGEGSSSSSMANSFELHDFVLFNRKDFGVIVGTEKDDNFKILKEGSEGPMVVTVEQNQLKNGSFEKKFTALDHQMKIISINDTVKVLEGPLQGREGIVKQIYRGIIFFHDENEQENSGYMCCKSKLCEKIKFSDDARKGKGGESGAGFDDFLSSPKSPLSPKKPWETRENNSNFNREDKDGLFSIGQSLRIRVGPLKGYLCRVLAIRRSDVTVKLDSQQKILTVKCEHLSEVRGKSSAISLGDDAESVKPFDLLGTEDRSSDWMVGAGTSAEGERWDAGGRSTERSSWPAFPSSAFSVQSDSDITNPLNTVDADTTKDGGDTAWESKVTPKKSCSWGSAVANEKVPGSSKKDGDWNKAKTVDGGQTESWGNVLKDDGATVSGSGGSSWGKILNSEDRDTSKGTWGNVPESQDKNTGKGTRDDSWGKAIEGSNKNDTVWNHSTPAAESKTSAWGNAGGSSWNKQDGGSSWSKQASGSTSGNQAGGCSWTRQPDLNPGEESKGGGRVQNDSWGSGGSSWVKDSTSSKTTSEDSWGKSAEKWSNKDDANRSKEVWKSSASASGGTSWNRQGAGTSLSNQAGGSSWSNQAGGSSWTKQASGNAGDYSKESTVQNDSLGKPSGGDQGFGGWDRNESGKKDEGQTSGWGNTGGTSWNRQGAGTSSNQAGGSSWSNQAGGSSWSKQGDGNMGDDSKGSAVQNDTWGKPPGGDRGFGGWNRNGTGNKDDTNQQESWDGRKTFGGRGSGGRRGRGGNRGGRDQFGRGRSFGRGQSSGWSKEGQDYSWDKGNDGSSWSKPVGSPDKDASEKFCEASWCTAPEWGRRDGPGGSKTAWTDSIAAPGNQTAGWGNAKSGQSEGGGWEKSRSVDGSMQKDASPTDWGSSGGSWGKAVDSQDKTIGKGMEVDSLDKAAEKWSSKGGSSGTKACWNNSSANTDGNSSGAAAEHKDQEWSNAAGTSAQLEADTSGWKKATGVDGGQSSSWSNMKKEDGATGWGRGGSTCNKTMDFQDKGSGKENHEGSWGKAAEKWNNKDWSSGSKASWNDGGKDGSWDTSGRSSWNKQDGERSWNKQDGGSSFSKEAGGSSWSGSDRGGFGGGRGRSDRGGYGGRGRSDRGAFRGRERSERGGFGGRGRGRRDQNDDWSSRNFSGEDKPYGFGKGSNSDGGWKSNDSGGSWNQAGGNTGKTWNSDWKPSKGSRETGGSDAQVGVAGTRELVLLRAVPTHLGPGTSQILQIGSSHQLGMSKEVVKMEDHLIHGGKQEVTRVKLGILVGSHRKELWKLEVLMPKQVGEIKELVLLQATHL